MAGIHQKPVKGVGGVDRPVPVLQIDHGDKPAVRVPPVPRFIIDIQPDLFPQQDIGGEDLRRRSVWRAHLRGVHIRQPHPLDFIDDPGVGLIDSEVEGVAVHHVGNYPARLVGGRRRQDRQKIGQDQQGQNRSHSRLNLPPLAWGTVMIAEKCFGVGYVTLCNIRYHRVK